MLKLYGPISEVLYEKIKRKKIRHIPNPTFFSLRSLLLFINIQFYLFQEIQGQTLKLQGFRFFTGKSFRFSSLFLASFRLFSGMIPEKAETFSGKKRNLLSFKVRTSFGRFWVCNSRQTGRQTERATNRCNRMG